MSKNIYVYGDWESLGQPVLIGILNVDLLKGKEIFSFEYDTEWLKTQKFSFFDPDLQLYKGRQYAQQNKELFGFFTDSCPDRWGRLLMTRSKAQNQKKTYSNCGKELCSVLRLRIRTIIYEITVSCLIRRA